MKKIFTLFFAAVWAMNSWGDNPQIGTGTDVNMIAPANFKTNYSIAEMLYTTTQLSAAGIEANQTINGICFKFKQNYTFTRKWKVYMLNSSFNTTATNMDSPEAVNLVYDGDVNISQGWVSITFTTPFVWSPAKTTKTLQVTIYDYSGESVSQFERSFYATNINTNQVCAKSGSSEYNPTGSISGATTSTLLPDIQFILNDTPAPSLTSSVSTLDFKDFTAGETATKTFTVSGANLTEDITISTTSSAFSVSPTSISKEDAGTATTVTVTLSATQATDFSNQVISITSSEQSKTVTVKGNVYAPEPKDIGSFANLLAETTPQKYIYTYTGTSAKILSLKDDYKQITLKDASNKSVQVQLTDAQWETINPVNGMKVQSFVFTAEISVGIQPQALCTPITLTFKEADFSRTITSTDLATICLKGDVSNFAKLQEQATFYKILCKQEYQGEVYNIVLEEVNTNMEAGKPYIFQPKAPCTMEFYYSATTDFAGSENGLIGTFTKIESAVDNILVGKYLISNNMFCKAGEYCSLAANRAYIDIDQVPAEENAAPKVGMRHINLQNADARQLPTNLNETQTHNSVRKAIVNGRFVIINNNKAFNAIGAEIQ